MPIHKQTAILQIWEVSVTRQINLWKMGSLWKEKSWQGFNIYFSADIQN